MYEYEYENEKKTFRDNFFSRRLPSTTILYHKGIAYEGA